MTREKHSTRPGDLSALFSAKRTVMQENGAASAENGAIARHSRSCRVSEIVSRGARKTGLDFSVHLSVNRKRRNTNE